MQKPKFLGKTLYIITKPAIYRLLKDTTRVYAVITVGNELLVTKNWLGLHATWRLPGGGVKHGEPVMIALHREITEELGITLPPAAIQPLHQEVLYTPEKRFYFWLYRVQLPEKPLLNINKAELLDAAWQPLSDLEMQVCSAELAKALELLHNA